MKRRGAPLVIIVLLIVGSVAYTSRAHTIRPARAMGSGSASVRATPSASRASRAIRETATTMPSPTVPSPAARQRASTPAASATPTRTSATRARHVRRAEPLARKTPRPVAQPVARPLAARTPTAQSGVPRARPTPTLAPSSGPVQVGEARFSLFTVNPRFFRQQVSFDLSAPARVRVRIAQPGDTRHMRTMDLGVRPTGTVDMEWDGRDNAHRLVPAGAYSYTITATNARGERQTTSYDMLAVTYKRIVVSLSRQQLWAFDGSHYVMSALVTTGNPALPTPLGHFPILARYSPFTFVSPWPPGSQYYYAPSYTTYALLFDNRGYYVHDAPWRGHFGPGSNAATGTPGQNYTGTHGCVNVPPTTMQPLFQWATIGTVVEVVR